MVTLKELFDQYFELKNVALTVTINNRIYTDIATTNKFEQIKNTIYSEVQSILCKQIQLCIKYGLSPLYNEDLDLDSSFSLIDITDEFVKINATVKDLDDTFSIDYCDVELSIPIKDIINFEYSKFVIECLNKCISERTDHMEYYKSCIAKLNAEIVNLQEDVKKYTIINHHGILKNIKGDKLE